MLVYGLIDKALQRWFAACVMPTPTGNNRVGEIQWENGDRWLVDTKGVPGRKILASTNSPTWPLRKTACTPPALSKRT